MTVMILSFVIIISSGSSFLCITCFILNACFFLCSGLFYFLLVFPSLLITCPDSPHLCLSILESCLCWFVCVPCLCFLVFIATVFQACVSVSVFGTVHFMSRFLGLHCYCVSLYFMPMFPCLCSILHLHACFSAGVPLCFHALFSPALCSVFLVCSPLMV